jgi:GNAT superfamily N-acetyltransferase
MSLALKCLGLLPERTRLSILRRQMGFAERDLEGVVVKIADSPDEALAASHILHRAYVRRGLVVPHPSALRVTPHGILPTTYTFVAIRDGEYVGTLSLVGDGALGLPLSVIYGAEIDRYRRAGERLAEVGSLAVLPRFRKRGIAWLLYRLMYETARSEGIDRLVAAVHPEARDLYRAALLFRTFGEERSYPGLNASARAIAIELDLRGAEQRFERAFGHLPEDTRNPFYVCVTSERPEIDRAPPPSAARHAAMARALITAWGDVFPALSWDARAELRRVLPFVPQAPRETGLGERDLLHAMLACLVPA